VTGQNSWYLISQNENLYLDIIEPIGYRAKEHNEEFLRQKSIIVNEFTSKFIDVFCMNYEIDWEKIVAFNSGNLDLK